MQGRLSPLSLSDSDSISLLSLGQPALPTVYTHSYLFRTRGSLSPPPNIVLHPLPMPDAEPKLAVKIGGPLRHAIRETLTTLKSLKGTAPTIAVLAISAILTQHVCIMPHSPCFPGLTEKLRALSSRTTPDIIPLAKEAVEVLIEITKTISAQNPSFNGIQKLRTNIYRIIDLHTHWEAEAERVRYDPFHPESFRSLLVALEQALAAQQHARLASTVNAIPPKLLARVLTAALSSHTVLRLVYSPRRSTPIRLLVQIKA
uniref:Uncharacterized protein n=1 Tax=Mycena chlorophos TaxID=658473 RepID=A0ABQ0LFB0_MYCCL|nr:predicted protein [Mycena chlorophos]